MDKPIRLHEYSLLLQGAKTVLRNLHDLGKLVLDPIKGADAKAYNDATYELLMNDESFLIEWMASPRYISWQYYDHERDKKGKLVKVKAKYK